MARDLTAGVQTEIAASKLRPVAFYEGQFSGGPLRLWSGLGTKSWDGKTWTGAGNLLSFELPAETADVRAEGGKVSLSGVPTALISVALAEAQLGLEGNLWIGFLDATGTVIADPYRAFVGRLDQPVIDDAGETCTITIAYEHRLADLQRPRVRRWTDQDQRNLFPGDKGFHYVATLQDQVIQW